MPVTATCTGCGRQVRGSDNWAGRQGQCPQCGATIAFPLLMPDFVLPLPAIPASLRVPRARRWRISHWMLAAFLILVGLCFMRLAISLATARPSNGPNPAVASSAGMTKAQFRGKFEAMCSSEIVGDLAMSPWNAQNLRLVREADVNNTFGPPFRTQTVMGESFWYWQCTDGTVQVVLHKRPDLIDTAGHKDALHINDINDY
jgi:hypothetical protein